MSRESVLSLREFKEQVEIDHIEWVNAEESDKDLVFAMFSFDEELFLKIPKLGAFVGLAV